ncbi:MsnO8 family LLM class oxidoreductase [Bacillus mangrovi]|uniref:MsnO8 family LLM class oxidoreductase n=1 Tax=Metabacillus mangrovi TaxID=1491830 RepID=A0A7X2S2C3_9BACI|nr:LLM class flavin-dependent oxidoreductase [Metabacillus mangrovi]MTH51941.1 MsnO8 family LLM class oxidoreductase [Metabacillus mangrovi]
MKLSILDQSAKPSDAAPLKALQSSLRLAQTGEELGYSRYWIAEHHDLPGLTSSAPEIMLAWIGGQTSRIRLGAGAILLPHYKPYKVAETFHMLATLFPGRIDLGISRSPGGSAEASIALSGNFLRNVKQLPDSLRELLHFIDHDFPVEHMYSKLNAAPLPAVPPQVFVLGTSMKSADLAAENGTGYAFGHFMGSEDPSVIARYSETYKPRSGNAAPPHRILTVSAVCAETPEKAAEIAYSGQVWQLMLAKGEGADGIPSAQEAKDYPKSFEDEEKLAAMSRNALIGTPSDVKMRLQQLSDAYGADEVMIITNVYAEEDKLHSYKLLAEACL